MASLAANIGTGTTVAFGTSSYSTQILSVAMSGVSRPALNTSHLGTTAVQSGDWNNATFLPGEIVDGGEVTLECHYNPDVVPPFDSAAETITITVNGGATLVFSGFVTDADVNMGLDEVMTQSLTIKVAGPNSHTDAA